jgi:hypothetical protein
MSIFVLLWLMILLQFSVMMHALRSELPVATIRQSFIRPGTKIPFLRRRSASSSSINDSSERAPQNFTIIGGGLAGLSTAFHILQKAPSGSHVTVLDKAPVGTAGASSVAGGYVLDVNADICYRKGRTSYELCQ